ncbi:MAG: hypothetical protein SFW07_04355 [Gammaproteobacteria bacterium]|nr:hypothetical protein [Gammaproteobacteria bacterium]
MIATLRNTFNQVLSQLKTHRILRAYEKADLSTQSKMYVKELRRIGKDKYNLEAYFRLSIMAPKKTLHARNTLSAIGISDRYINNRLTQLQKSHSRTYNAILKPRGR